MWAVMHTVNIRLSPEQVAYVINHAGDRVIILDASLRELFEPVLPLLTTVEHIILSGDRRIFTVCMTAPMEGIAR